MMEKQLLCPKTPKQNIIAYCEISIQIQQTALLCNAVSEDSASAIGSLFAFVHQELSPI